MDASPLATCAGCSNPLPIRSGPGRPRRWCSEACRVRGHHERKKVPCGTGCGQMCWNTNMCRICRTAQTAAARPACARCGSRIKRGQTKYCSTTCSNRATNSIRATGRDPAIRRASYRAKNYRRRNVRHALHDVTADYESALRVKAKRCPLCAVKMTDVPHLPNSKELDHIIPVNVGGTHTIGNVRIICRCCNQKRPKDGSDYQGPVTLWAQDPEAAPTMRPRPRDVSADAVTALPGLW